MPEKVLCVEQAAFRGLFQSLGVPAAVTTTIYIHGITPEQWRSLSVPFRFVDRSVCETDDSLKQMIPYVILRHAGRYLTYTRTNQSGETRLAGKKSIGLGGHINPSDQDGGTLLAALRRCAAREVLEELGAAIPTDAFEFRGILYSAMDDVSRKHFAAVALAGLDPSAIRRPEHTLTALEWKTPFELHRARRDYETWSSFLAMHLMRHKEL